MKHILFQKLRKRKRWVSRRTTTRLWGVENLQWPWSTVVWWWRVNLDHGEKRVRNDEGSESVELVIVSPRRRWRVYGWKRTMVVVGSESGAKLELRMIHPVLYVIENSKESSNVSYFQGELNVKECKMQKNVCKEKKIQNHKTIKVSGKFFRENVNEREYKKKNAKVSKLTLRNNKSFSIN